MAPRDEITSDFFMFHERRPIFSRDIELFGDHNTTTTTTTTNINNMAHHDNNNTTMTTEEIMNDVNDGRIPVDIQALSHNSTGDSLVLSASSIGDDDDDGGDGLDTIIEENIIESNSNNESNNNNNSNDESFNIADQIQHTSISIPALLSLSSSLTSIVSSTTASSEYSSSSSENESDGDDDDIVVVGNNNINVTNSSKTTPPSVVTIDDTILHDLKSIADDDDDNNHYQSPVVLLSSLLPSLNSLRLKAITCHLLLRQVKRAPPQKKITMASDIKILRFLANAISSSIDNDDDDDDDDNDVDDMIFSSDLHHHRRSSTSNSQIIIDAAETLQSLTAVEATDRYLMACDDLPSHLARCAAAAASTTSGIPIKASLHSCIALMNLSCGNMENKRMLVSCKVVLESLRDLLLSASSSTQQHHRRRNDDGDLICRRRVFYMTKIHARATACIKNLTYSDETTTTTTHEDMLNCPGLIKALALTADIVNNDDNNDNDNDDDENDNVDASKNALLTIVELSIPVRNKIKLFQTEGLIEVLMRLLWGRQTTQQQQRQTIDDGDNHHHDYSSRRMMACLALVNLVNGHENRVATYKYPGFVELIVKVIKEEKKKHGSSSSDLMNKALGILWNFAAEVKNQASMIQRHDILPLLVSIIHNPSSDSEPITKCLSTLTLLAETSSLAPKLYNNGAHITPLCILNSADPDPHRWAISNSTPYNNNNNRRLYGNNSNTTAPSRSLGLLLNLSQNEHVARHLRDDDNVLSILSPYIRLSDHYQGLKAAMTAINLCCCRSSDDDNDNSSIFNNERYYEVLRSVERTVPKIISLLVNTLAGRGGSEYEYGVFQLRSSLGCISLLASCGPEFAKDMVTNRTVFRCLVKVLEDYCSSDDSRRRRLCPIVGGGRDDALVASLAVKTLYHLTKYLIPVPWMASEYMPLDEMMMERLLTVLECFELKSCSSLDNNDCGGDDVATIVEKKYVEMARETQCLILGGRLKRIRMDEGRRKDDKTWGDDGSRLVQQQQQQQSRRVTRKRKAMVVEEENDTIKNKCCVGKS